MPFANEPFRGTRRVPSVHNLRTDRVSRRWWWRHARCRSGSEYARALGFRADLCSPHHPHVRQRPGRSASVHPARRQRHGRGWTGRDPFPTREQGDSCHLETSGDLRDAMHWHLASRWHALGLPHSSGTTLPPPWSRAGREDGQDLANMIPDGPLLSLTIRLLNRERQRGLFPGSPFQLSALKVKFCKTKAERKPPLLSSGGGAGKLQTLSPDVREAEKRASLHRGSASRGLSHGVASPTLSREKAGNERAACDDGPAHRGKLLSTASAAGGALRRGPGPTPCVTLRRGSNPPSLLVRRR